MTLNEIQLTIESLKNRYYKVGPSSPERDGLMEEIKRLEKEYLSRTDKKTNTNTMPKWAQEQKNSTINKKRVKQKGRAKLQRGKR